MPSAVRDDKTATLGHEGVAEHNYRERVVLGQGHRNTHPPASPSSLLLRLKMVGRLDLQTGDFQ